MKTALRALAIAVTMSLAFSSVAAQATHTSDVHSENMSLIAEANTGPGGEVAFWRNLAVLAHAPFDEDSGFRILDVSKPEEPVLIGSFECAGSAWDVSVYRDLVLLSAGGNQTSIATVLGGSRCDADEVPRGAPGGFAGLRVVSIRNPAQPELLASVNTCRPGDISRNEPPTDCYDSGEHTHTLLPDLDHRVDGRKRPRLVVYGSGGIDEVVIEVPLGDPRDAKVLNRFTAPELCHDVSVFRPRNLLFCAGGGSRFSLWDISEDPIRPDLISAIDNTAVSHGHGGAFSWDGQTLIVADENVPNFAADRCPTEDESTEGALWFYNIANPRTPTLRGRYQLPAEQRRKAGGFCSAHQFNVVPLRDGRDVLVAAWYQGGTTVVDFTDPAIPPKQVGYHNAAPGQSTRYSNPWSSYWYRRHIYSNNVRLFPTGTTERGLDVFSITDPLVEQAIFENSYNFGLQECLPKPGKAHGDLTTCR